MANSVSILRLSVPVVVETGEKRNGDEAQRIRRGRKSRRRKHGDARGGDDGAGNREDVRARALSLFLFPFSISPELFRIGRYG